MKQFDFLLIAGLVFALPFSAWSVESPAPLAPVPTARQIRWHEMELTAFIHFTTNTFTDKEWGYGDEGGVAGDPCWATVNPKMWISGRELNSGDRNGPIWMPGETNTSIRPGWFYHESEDDRVKSSARLMQLYFESVGRSTNLLLNVPPDRRGVIHENDVKALREWGCILNATFSNDLARGTTASADNIRGHDRQFAPDNTIDGNRETYWTTDDSVTTPTLTLTFPKPVTFNVVRLREYLPLGQRVDAFAMDFDNAGRWELFAEASGIGSQRVLPTRYITTGKVRLRITKAAVCPAISELGLFAMPTILSEPKIVRDRAGNVTLATDFPGPWIRYTLDSSEPTGRSTIYENPIPLPKGGVVKARVFSPAGAKQSSVVTESFGLSKAKWKVRASYAAKGGAPELVIDENPRSIWNTWTKDNTQGAPQEIVIAFGELESLRGFTLLPRQDGMTKGTPDRYEVYVSGEDGKWGSPAACGEFPNIRTSKELQSILFKKPVVGRYLRFVATHVLDDEKQVAVPEIGAIPLLSNERDAQSGDAK